MLVRMVDPIFCDGEGLGLGSIDGQEVGAQDGEDVGCYVDDGKCQSVGAGGCQ